MKKNGDGQKTENEAEMAKNRKRRETVTSSYLNAADFFMKPGSLTKGWDEYLGNTDDVAQDPRKKKRKINITGVDKLATMGNMIVEISGRIRIDNSIL